MNYDEVLALLMDGQMGYLPNDGSNYSILVKKIYNGKPCECIFPTELVKEERKAHGESFCLTVSRE